MTQNASIPHKQSTLNSVKTPFSAGLKALGAAPQDQRL